MKIRVCDEAEELANEAADFVSEKINETVDSRGEANILFATADSQLLFLEALQKKDINWEKITILHLDEYVGINEDHPASFRKILKDRLLEKVQPGAKYLIKGETSDISKEINRYSGIINSHPIDVACIGIGENGHIAFNDPHVADFDDPKIVKVVEIDEICRNQQYTEGWFPKIEDVPKEAITLTIPAILRSKIISCVVPGERKAEAVYKTLYGKISTVCPASILRTNSNTVLFLDSDSASKIDKNGNTIKFPDY